MYTSVRLQPAHTQPQSQHQEHHPFSGTKTLWVGGRGVRGICIIPTWALNMAEVAERPGSREAVCKRSLTSHAEEETSGQKHCNV